MQYYSLNRNSPAVNFKEATMNGQAPDKGLYFPERIPKLEPGFLQTIEKKSETEIAFAIIKPYIGDCIPDKELMRIVSETVNFPIPLERVSDSIYALELFHGPTLAFKDIGARFMSRCLGYFVKGTDTKITVLVATSGDTGGAVANGFYGVEGVEVVILYPSGKVSKVQEKQLTTLGENITALEVNGNFDDCQQMVKAAFTDVDLKKKRILTSANSINAARWLPQQFYYFFAYKQWPDKANPPVISIPSGNFGNICAGLLAQQSGLPVRHFIAACNANNVVPDYLKTKTYRPKKAVATISNAMDVGDPSNFVRILEIFNQDFEKLSATVSSCSIDDAQTRETLLSVYRQYHYLCDTHGAVAFAALENYLQKHPDQKGIFLETAHPVKFYDVVEPIIQANIPIPENIQAQLQKNKQAVFMEAGYEHLKEYLLNK
jgi:threonine synthase